MTLVRSSYYRYILVFPVIHCIGITSPVKKANLRLSLKNVVSFSVTAYNYDITRFNISKETHQFLQESFRVATSLSYCSL